MATSLSPLAYPRHTGSGIGFEWVAAYRDGKPVSNELALVKHLKYIHVYAARLHKPGESLKMIKQSFLQDQIELPEYLFLGIENTDERKGLLDLEARMSNIKGVPGYDSHNGEGVFIRSSHFKEAVDRLKWILWVGQVPA